MTRFLRFEPAPLISSPLGGPPAGGISRFALLDDGARLRVGVWPAGSTAEGDKGRWCLLLNGRTEYIEKYYEVIGELQQRGFGVITMDWRGQGLSSRFGASPDVGHVDQMETYLDDLDVVLAALADEIGTAALTILAHSMGGHLALRFASRHPQRCRALALSAPMTGVRLPIPRFLLEPAVKLFIALGKSNQFILSRGQLGTDWDDFAANIVTRDQARFDHDVSFMKVEPALNLGGPSYGWVAAALKSIDYVMSPQLAATLTMPILLASARADQIVIPESHDQLMGNVKSGTLLKIEDSEHEILRERDHVRAVFWKAFDQLVSA